ncbi:hypothetical protein A9P82_13115 [Arachidicoccus ginsenosidimutans]|uniref:hypothetical protein n=1 Tax=Arachidicoccus sp. BS20 TaxID=1850526 RepID=UPI0007F0AB24|nr:hypothetical protein [Arachidicoccus sp. BS20]ANI90142.1 hypothetical protein A9P82_13115 [Arachidicoccus sp. BS20]
MKKILFLSFAALSFAATTHAQSADTKTPRGGRMNREAMIQRQEAAEAKALDLTDDQKTQFAALDKAQFAKMDSIRQSGSGDRQAFMDIMKETNDKKKALLTPDQQTKWDAYQKERMQRFRRPRGGNGGGQQ